MPPPILVVVDDLFFLAKIQQTARQVGVPIETVEPSKAEVQAAEGPVRSVILDLNHRSGKAVDTIRTLKENQATKNVRLLAFLSHVQSDLAAAARDAGCDVVLARSAFSQQLPQLLMKLSSG